MLRSLESLEFSESHANGLELQMCTQGKMIEMPFDGKSFQFENGVQGRKDMVVLPDDPADRRFALSGILFERFVEAFHRPSFLIGH